MHFLNKVFTFFLFTQTRQSVANNEKKESQNGPLDSVEEKIKPVAINSKKEGTWHAKWMYDIDSEYCEYFEEHNNNRFQYNPKSYFQIEACRRNFFRESNQRFSKKNFDELKNLYEALTSAIEMQCENLQLKTKIEDDGNEFGLKTNFKYNVKRPYDTITVDMIFVYKLIMNTTYIEDSLYINVGETYISKSDNNDLKMEFKKKFLTKHLMILELIYEKWQNHVEEFLTSVIFNLMERVKEELDKILNTASEGMPEVLISWLI